MASLGDKLRERRKALRMTLDELAAKVDSSKGYIWELENRTSANPSADKLAAIADALEVPLEFFLDDADTHPTEQQVDAAFFRKYKKLGDDEKAQLRAIVETFKKRKK